jgi:hypothetical protein
MKTDPGDIMVGIIGLQTKKLMKLPVRFNKYGTGT